jgi:class 3 adenylate cyclase
MTATPAAPVRKTVTIVFSDVVGSTPLGELLDPESLREVVTSYYQQVATVLERHGGRVSKFIGDAVLAVFGVPWMHEDDALRAVRAASELPASLEALNADLEAAWGLRILLRTGVNTGEVVVGDDLYGQDVTVGDAVNLAARLEQAAAPGEVLLGESTHRLVRDAVEADPLPPLAVKGKAQPVGAWRLRAVRPDAPGGARRADAPLVGRGSQRDRLTEAFERSAANRACCLLTLVGPAGVGKSRLAAEFVASVSDRATVLRGRCLSYGDGITFWPVAEILRQAAGITGSDPPATAQAKLARLVAGEERAERVAELAGGVLRVAGEAGQLEETFWAIRRVLEVVAAGRPLVVVLDDLHWAEPTLLDLVEHVATWSRDRPILLLCLSRPDLIEQRPAWGAGAADAALVQLEPLAEDEGLLLLDELLGASELDGATRRRIVRTAEGNPLFIEELVASITERSTAGELPTSVRALIAARLDSLPADERSVIVDASVVGRVFWRGALTKIAKRDNLTDLLGSLEARDLIRREAVSRIRGDQQYGFKHGLIHDVAYQRLPRAERRERHAAVAGFLEEATGEMGQSNEALAHHWREAGEPRRAVDCLIAAADQAGRGWAKEHAVALYKAALELVPDDEALQRSIRLRLVVAAHAFAHIVQDDVGRPEDG